MIIYIVKLYVDKKDIKKDNINKDKKKDNKMGVLIYIQQDRCLYMYIVYLDKLFYNCNCVMFIFCFVMWQEFDC